MLGPAFRDPKVRQAYIMTKVAVFSGAAALTWPLSKMIGPKAWIGLGVFGAILAALTVAVLALGSSPPTPDEDDTEEDDDAPLPPDDPIVIPIEDSLDLHPFPPADVANVVADYLDEAVAAGFSEVRLIHGRGIGVQRERVRSLLSRHPLVTSHADAPPERGGWGATIARLDNGHPD